MRARKEFIFESIFLLMVFGILLWMGMGAYYGNVIDYDHPRGFMATDSFYKYNRVVYLDKTSDNTHIPPYMAGGVEGFAQDYPFLTFHNSVLLKDISGLKNYNAHFLLKIIYIILGGLVSYIMIRRYNKKIAILATGVFGFLFINSFYTPVIFGWGPQILGSLYLVMATWIMLNFNLKGFNILLGITIGAGLLAHPTETFFASIICAIIFISDFIKNRFDIKMIRKGTISVMIALVLSIYYLPIFIEKFLKGSGTGNFGFSAVKSSFPAPIFSDFGFYGWIIIIGFISAIILFFTKKGKNWKYFTMCIVMGLITFSVLFVSIISQSPYQMRYFWPIYFAILFGLGIYTLIRFIPLKIPKTILYLIPLIFLFISSTNYFEPMQYSGLIANKDMWEGITWVKENIPQENTVLVVYGDSYNQHAIFSMFGRLMHYTMWNYIPNNIGFDLTESIVKIQKKEITRKYPIRVWTHGHIFLKRITPFKTEKVDIYDLFGYDKKTRENKGFQDMDICIFDYYLIDKLSKYKELMDYNIKLRTVLMKNDYINEVFSNYWYSILKNNMPGKDCIKNE